MPVSEFASSIASSSAVPARGRGAFPEPAAPARPGRGGPAACALFIIDESDAIQTYRVAEADRWFYHAAELQGRSLRALLAELNPLWARRLPASLWSDEAPVFLPELAAELPGLGLTLHRLRGGGQMSVTIVPELAPPAELRQAGLADLTIDPATFARLFLRLRTTESRLEHYMAHLPGVVFHQRVDQSFAFIGPGFENLTGLDPAPLLRNGQPLLRLIHEDDEPAYHREVALHADATKPFSLVYRLCNPATDTTVYLLDVRSPVRAASGLLLGFEGVWLDITRQKIAEHRLTSRGWKESLATLTSGLLHDFSNVMTGIYSLSDLYHHSLKAEDPLHDGIGLIKDNAAHAQRLLRRIVELHREPADERNYADLGSLVREQSDLLQVVLPRGTQLTTPSAHGEWPVLIDHTGFRQALVNFAMNSRDALHGAGDVRIALRKLAVDAAPLAGTHPALAPVRVPSVELVFADNGSGIAAPHLPRVFDPFFTTKDLQRGSGLGLYNVRSFAEDHGGAVAIRSLPGRGTEVVLVLPLADLTLSTSKPRVTTATTAPTRRPRVLYFEPGMTDEGSLVEELHSREWEVRTVATLEHARRHLREEGPRMDLVFIRQPQLDASLRELLATIRRDHPGLPVAVKITGQDPDDLGTSFRAQVDLLVSSDLRDRDVADTLASLLRLP